MRKHKEYFKDYECPLVPTYFYHIYGRTNGRELLFRTDENRVYFLRKMASYLIPVLDVYAYCLIPNHFHLLARVKPEVELDAFIRNVPRNKKTLVQHECLEQAFDVRDWNSLVVHQFSRFLNGYSKSFNRQYERSGNLLNRPFKRVVVKSDMHFQNLIFYIHANPKKHGVQNNFRGYKWSSFFAMLSDSPTQLKRDMVLDWFGGRDGFVEYHHKVENWKDIGHLVIED